MGVRAKAGTCADNMVAAHHSGVCAARVGTGTTLGMKWNITPNVPDYHLLQQCSSPVLQTLEMCIRLYNAAMENVKRGLGHLKTDGIGDGCQ